jgi:hypothetical protein
VLRGVSSGEALAYGRCSRPGAALCSTPARASCTSRIPPHADEVEVVHPPCVLKPAELARWLPPRVPIRRRERGQAAGWTPSSAPLTTDVAPRAGLLQLGATGSSAWARGPQEIEPLYLRPFAAQARKR